jgi:hypothetical protein
VSPVFGRFATCKPGDPLNDANHAHSRSFVELAIDQGVATREHSQDAVGKTTFMGRQNDDIEQLKASVSCALVLERLQPDWRLDAAQSTRRNLKFRRGPGKILIVNHDGRGWWDPLSAAKGDVFSLAQLPEQST